MFKDTQKTKEMLQGAYRKLKSYYYYNKNFIVMRKKIADFEYDTTKMDETFNMLSDVLCHPRRKASQSYLANLLDNIDFYVVPKKFESNAFINDSVISNTIPRDKKMKTVNFFINAPIELHILDTLWTVFLAKMDNDKNVISKNVYGNTINKPALFFNEEIGFENRFLFNRYFNKYTAWRNNAFEVLEDQYALHRDSLLVSLDIKSYFYSVSFSFGQLKDIFDNHEILTSISVLTKIIERMYEQYLSKIIPFRQDLVGFKKGHSPLPIGLFSSMVVANLYLKDFDQRVTETAGVMYYGRYVDDLLFVLDRTVDKSQSVLSIIKDIFVKNGLFECEGQLFLFANYDRLCVQASKIKLLYIDHTESRAIIDIYNDTIKIVPSQMNLPPDSTISLLNFDEVAYSVENFTKEKKIRDIGLMAVDAFKVSKFFSALPRRYSQIDTAEANKEINDHIKHIEEFFTGSQSVEFHSNWLNYMYFLVITEKNTQLHSFVSQIKKRILDLSGASLDTSLFKRRTSINKKAKDFLQLYLETCLGVSLCLNAPFAQKHFSRSWEDVQKYLWANIFEHSLVTFPLANYLDYDQKGVSFCRMSLNDIGRYPEKMETSFKFIWSPRFVHYDELLLLLFYHYHKQNKHGSPYPYDKNSLVDKFTAVNHLRGIPFKIVQEENNVLEGYSLRSIQIPIDRTENPYEVSVAIGSINIPKEKCIAPCRRRWANTTIAEKDAFFDILRETYSYLWANKKRNSPMFLVLPELCFPPYWIRELVDFVKKTQIGVITGLQYLGDENQRQYNYIASILPFTTGQQHHKNAFIYIREKNDYSPIEFEELAKVGFTCKNRNIAEYQVFNWNGVTIAPFVCYELTDIVARALLKGKCDFITASVFNPDTTYFSNIIDSTVRDLHSFVVQANTSYYGDSRITGPYDRDSKDVFKLKGGDNDHVVIGTINFQKYREHQKTYYDLFDRNLAIIDRERKKRKPNYPQKDRSKPNIKPLSARYKFKK